MEALKKYFTGCHTKDANSRTYNVIVKSEKQQCGAWKGKCEKGWTKVQSKKPSSTYRKSGGEQEPQRFGCQTERFNSRYGNIGRKYQRSHGEHNNEYCVRHGNAGRSENHKSITITDAIAIMTTVVEETTTMAVVEERIDDMESQEAKMISMSVM